MREDMTCARAEELLSDHLEGTLGEPLRGELEGHLARCAACQALREELAFVASALREFPELLPSPTLAERAAEAALRARNVLPFEAPARGWARPGRSCPCPGRGSCVSPPGRSRWPRASPS